MRPILLSIILIGLALVSAQSVNFNEQATFTTLHYAYAAFCPETNLNQWNCTWCLQNEDFTFVSMLTDPATNAYGFVGFTNETIYVSFRGTRSLKNILDDLEFFTTSDYPAIPGARVHDGFHHTYNSVQKQLRSSVSLILSHCESCKTIVTTGHSLGAALSGLAAVDMAVYLSSIQRTDVTVAMRNFGMPRVGNDAFAEGFAKLISLEHSWRLVHDRDIVPHLPPRSMGFHAVRTEIWNKDDIKTPSPRSTHLFSSGGDVRTSGEQYTVCNSSGEDPRCSNSELDFSGANHMTYMGVLNDNCESDFAL